MQVLNIDEIQSVAGGGTRDIVQSATVAGGARIGSYLAAARFGAAFGAPAGIVGGLIGAGIATAVCYYWNSKHPSE